MPTAEHRRLAEINDEIYSWRRWGPFLSDRAWATVREDYSSNGDAWGYLPHDLARSKAYRWGEDGIAGICDRYQLLCFAPAFWNGVDPILKERFFGLTPHEGNHGEDVKEYYFHADNTPTHSYMRLLYKYPQVEFPYHDLIQSNRARQGQGGEYELLDTGAFTDNRYFDIVIEYAKLSAEDLCIRITAHNRGPQAAPLYILPHLWFRNTWAWSDAPAREPVIRAGATGSNFVSFTTDDSGCESLGSVPVSYRLGSRTLYGPAGAALLFTNNETNAERVYGPGHTSRSPYVKDAFHHAIIGPPAGSRKAPQEFVNPQGVGTKSTLLYHFAAIAPGASVTLQLRLSDQAGLTDPLSAVGPTFTARQQEADEFYAALHHGQATADERRVQRQALAGLLWSKQSYLFDVDVWLKGDSPKTPPPSERRTVRNHHWKHLNSMRIMTMPDKWEYPWFAAWDLAFHCVAFGQIDPGFAKDQLWMLLFEQFQHPNGQIPAYEWEFSDLNPPVHAWAVWRVYSNEQFRTGKGDREFLERCFHKLLMNFAWWINKVDSGGNNIFEGGFLGLDNITVVDRSVACADGSVLEQADATGWMGMFCLNMMRISLELAHGNPAYESLATKFFQHYVLVAAAMKRMGNRDYQLWDSTDGFFYDVLRFPNGHYETFRVRSLVGLIPLFAVERLEANWIEKFKGFNANFQWFLKNRADLAADVVHVVERDGHKAHLLTIVNEDQIQCLLNRVWDPAEFLSPYGVRSLSKWHEAHPFEYDGRTVHYEPGEAHSKIKGGNSNWRGPIWLPTNFLLIESLRKLGQVYGAGRKLQLPGGRSMAYREMANDLADRLIGLFTRDDTTQRRAVFGDSPTFQQDPHWRDHLLFYEYFHGDTGAGLGASHQTGWTALAASLIDEWRT